MDMKKFGNHRNKSVEDYVAPLEEKQNEEQA